jgi:hypothetical protein
MWHPYALQQTFSRVALLKLDGHASNDFCDVQTWEEKGDKQTALYLYAAAPFTVRDLGQA